MGLKSIKFIKVPKKNKNKNFFKKLFLKNIDYSNILTLKQQSLNQI